MLEKKCEGYILGGIMVELMRDNNGDDYGFHSLQNKILNIMSKIDFVCKNNNIDYCLMGGSALGSKRHKGFIPWDDDLDIFMTPQNYDNFRKVFKKMGNEYYLQELGESNGMVTISKVRLNNTTYIEEIVKEWDIHHGIYVDIFILHNTPNNKIKRLWQWSWAKYIVVKGLANKNYNRRKGLAKILVKLFKFLPKRFLLDFALIQVYKYRNIETSNYCNFLGKAIYKKGIYKKIWFQSNQYVPFEKIHLKVPNEIDDFLFTRFGEYMKIPSPEMIKWEQHAWKWDTNKDFREYLSNIDKYFDEKYLF